MLILNQISDKDQFSHLASKDIIEEKRAEIQYVKNQNEKQQCFECNRSLAGYTIQSYGKQFHPDCFGCHSCHKKFTKCMNISGWPYCESCGKTAFISCKKDDFSDLDDSFDSSSDEEDKQFALEELRKAKQEWLINNKKKTLLGKQDDHHNVQYTHQITQEKRQPIKSWPEPEIDKLKRFMIYRDKGMLTTIQFQKKIDELESLYGPVPFDVTKPYEPSKKSILQPTGVRNNVRKLLITWDNYSKHSKDSTPIFDRIREGRRPSEIRTEEIARRLSKERKRLEEMKRKQRQEKEKRILEQRRRDAEKKSIDNLINLLSNSTSAYIEQFSTKSISLLNKGVITQKEIDKNVQEICEKYSRMIQAIINELESKEAICKKHHKPPQQENERNREERMRIRLQRKRHIVEKLHREKEEEKQKMELRKEEEKQQFEQKREEDQLITVWKPLNHEKRQELEEREMKSNVQNLKQREIDQYLTLKKECEQKDEKNMEIEQKLQNTRLEDAMELQLDEDQRNAGLLRITKHHEEKQKLLKTLHQLESSSPTMLIVPTREEKLQVIETIETLREKGEILCEEYKQNKEALAIKSHTTVQSNESTDIRGKPTTEWQERVQSWRKRATNKNESRRNTLTPAKKPIEKTVPIWARPGRVKQRVDLYATRFTKEQKTGSDAPKAAQLPSEPNDQFSEKAFVPNLEQKSVSRAQKEESESDYNNIEDEGKFDDSGAKSVLDLETDQEQHSTQASIESVLLERKSSKLETKLDKIHEIQNFNEQTPQVVIEPPTPKKLNIYETPSDYDACEYYDSEEESYEEEPLKQSVKTVQKRLKRPSQIQLNQDDQHTIHMIDSFTKNGILSNEECFQKKDEIFRKYLTFLDEDLDYSPKVLPNDEPVEMRTRKPSLVETLNARPQPPKLLNQIRDIRGRRPSQIKIDAGDQQYIKTLSRLLENGIISEHDFERQKTKALEKAILKEKKIREPSKPMTTTEKIQEILEWANNIGKNYNIEVRNCTSSWTDGKMFCAIVNYYFPDKLDYNNLDHGDPLKNIKTAFDIYTKLGIDSLLDPEDAGKEKLSTLLYLVRVHRYFKKYD